MARLRLLCLFATALLCGAEDRVPGQLWTSGVNERFIDVSPEEFKKMLGSIPVDVKSIPKLSSDTEKKVGVPDNFTASAYWPHCADRINTARDQGSCSSGWASASAGAMSDVTCIRCNATVTPYLSEQDLIACCPNCGDCNKGGSVDSAFSYWKAVGVVTGGPYNSKEGCLPYNISQSGAGPQTCPNACVTWFPGTYTHDKHKGSIYAIASGEDDMKLQLYTYGPIVSTNFSVYEDFKNYKSGIYTHTSGALVGTHAVKIIGWGAENNVPYWLAVNSWGTKWGINGQFKIKRGTNECGIESQAIYGKASTDACFYIGPVTTTRKGASTFSPAKALIVTISLVLVPFF